MSKDLLLSIDNGTQSIRALLFDAQGTLLAKSKVTLEPYHSPQPGWAEHDPEYYWNALCQACQQLWAQPNVRKEAKGAKGANEAKEAIAAVAVTTQRATFINVDREGHALRPAI